MSTSYTISEGLGTPPRFLGTRQAMGHFWLSPTCGFANLREVLDFLDANPEAFILSEYDFEPESREDFIRMATANGGPYVVGPTGGLVVAGEGK